MVVNTSLFCFHIKGSESWDLMLSEISEREKDKNHMISLLWGIYIYVYIHIYIYTHIQTKPKHTDAENRIKVTEGGVGWGQAVKREQGVNCMEVDGS